MFQKFFKTIFQNILIYCCLIILLGTVIPATPKAKQSDLFSRNQKNNLLKINTNRKRILMVGGSNLAYGINSEMIRDSLNVLPINTSIGAGLGLVFMMNDILSNVRKNDIVLLVPEYHHFFGEFAYGECNDGEELTRMMIDVDKSCLKQIQLKQMKYLVRYLPLLSLSKLKWNEYFVNNNKHDNYNYFGDFVKHRFLKRKNFNPEKKLNLAKLNYSVIKEIANFRREINNKGAKLLISYPCYQDKSFNNSKSTINFIHKLLLNQKFKIISKPENYCMQDKYMYDTPYHLLNDGINLRTNKLIKDLKLYIK